MSDTYLSDNAGNRATPGVICADPVAASGLTIAMATAGNDYTQTVVAGQRYFCTVNGGFCLFSITGVTSTATNIEWCCEDGKTILIKIPQGKTTLYCESDANTTNAYLRKANEA